MVEVQLFFEALFASAGDLLGSMVTSIGDLMGGIGRGVSDILRGTRA